MCSFIFTFIVWFGLCSEVFFSFTFELFAGHASLASPASRAHRPGLCSSPVCPYRYSEEEVESRSWFRCAQWNDARNLRYPSLLEAMQGHPFHLILRSGHRASATVASYHSNGLTPTYTTTLCSFVPFIDSSQFFTPSLALFHW